MYTAPSFLSSLKEADENGSDGLDIDEFRAAFGQILGKGKNDQQVYYAYACVCGTLTLIIIITTVHVGVEYYFL